MPCFSSIGQIQPILAKSSLRQYRWFIRQPVFNLQPSRSLTAKTTTTTWRRRQSVSLMTTLLVGGCSSGMAMYYYHHYHNNNNNNNTNNIDHRYSSIQSLWRISRAVLVGMQVALDYQWWYISVRYFHSRSMDAEHAERLKQSCHLRSAKRVLKAMQDLGGIYIKLGQHMSAMHYILPDPWTSTLAVLQDQCPVVSTQAELEHMFWQETGKSMDQVFGATSSVDYAHPLGVASLAQVHKVDGDGPMVMAMKFQHPSIETYCRLDLQCVTTVMGAIQWLFPDFGFGWLVDEMNEALPQELDFRNEANNADRVRANFKDDPGALVVPKVIWATRRLLCMEYIEGARPDDLEYMKIHDIDPEQVSTEITSIFSKMMFIHGFVHCDPHPGNLLIRPSTNNESKYNFDVVLLDHGQYRTLSNDLRTDYAHLWTSLIRGDEKGIETYAYKLGCQAPHHRLFASLLTGREWHTIVSSQGLATPKTSKETDRVAGRSNLFLHKIASVLSTLPRIMLIMLKTSDLLRHLDMSLHSGGGGGGGKKKYGIMVQCCNEAVWLDERQQLWDRYATGLGWWCWFGWCHDYLVAWWDYSSFNWAIWLTLG